MQWETIQYIDQAQYKLRTSGLSHQAIEYEHDNNIRDLTCIGRYRKEEDKFIFEENFEGSWYEKDLYAIPKNFFSTITKKESNPNNLQAKDLDNCTEFYIYQAILENEKKLLIKSSNRNTNYGNGGTDIFSLRMPNDRKSKISKSGMVITKYINMAIDEKLERDGLL